MDRETRENRIQELNNAIYKSDQDEKFQAQEKDILELGKLLGEDNRGQDLFALIQHMRTSLSRLPKAKAANVLRNLMNIFLELETPTGLEAQLCAECISWATEQKNTFLRQSLESRLLMVLCKTGKYNEALTISSRLLGEIKKLDDRNLMVEVGLTESQAYHGLSNLSKSRASLTLARTTANAMYCPPRPQAELDLQSGILQAAESEDYKTAYSYFFEAFEGFNSLHHAKAVTALKYMLLCKIMLGLPQEVEAILLTKLALPYADRVEILALKAVAAASSNRSVSEFSRVLSDFQTELGSDAVIRPHLDNFYDDLLERNLRRVTEPYSTVQIDHVATKVGLPLASILAKLSQMILDGKLNGIIDQGKGTLVIFTDSKQDKSFDSGLKLIQNLEKVLSELTKKAKNLS